MHTHTKRFFLLSSRLFFLSLESTACILSRSGSFYLSRYLDHARIDAYDDTNELYLKAKWMRYYDTGSGLLLDFYFISSLFFLLLCQSTICAHTSSNSHSCSDTYIYISSHSSSVALVFPCPSTIVVVIVTCLLHFQSRSAYYKVHTFTHTLTGVFDRWVKLRHQMKSLLVPIETYH